MSGDLLSFVQFQFTLPCRERQDMLANLVPESAFQFTLPCRERLGDGAMARVGAMVSIHAPV